MSTEVAIPAPDSSVVPLIREAIASNADPAQLRELLAVRREWEADEALKAFNFAISDFQRRAPIIEKSDKAYDKAYARMDRIWREIRPLLTGLGLSVTWQICEIRPDGICHLEGQLRHKGGHGERLARDIPMPELIKGQNKAQQAGSASTYAQRYALCGALGIVTGDDDDGHAAATALATDEQTQAIAEKIDACRGLPSWNESAFWAWVKNRCGATAPDQISASAVNDVLAQLDRKLKGPAR